MPPRPAPTPTHRVASWRGRPRVADPKDKFVTVRCTSAQHAAWTTAAARSGTNIGDYLRTQADGRPSPRAVRRPPVELGELARVLGAIGRVGSNINQLAHVANATGALPQCHELAAIRGDVMAMRAAVMHALGRKAGQGGD